MTPLDLTDLVTCRLQVVSVSIDAAVSNGDQLDVVVKLMVPDRDDPRNLIEVRTNARGVFKTGKDEPGWKDTLVYVVRRALHDALLHEANEHLLFEGVRVDDPHK